MHWLRERHDPAVRLFEIVQHYMHPFRPQMEIFQEGGTALVERWELRLEAFPDRVFRYYPRKNMLEHSRSFLLDDFAIRAGKFFNAIPAPPVGDNVVLGEN